MLEVLESKSLLFTFSELGENVSLNISFQRTIRVPDDGEEYPLPAGLGSFPIKHIEDYSKKLPGTWASHGGIMLPVHENEALWIKFTSSYIQNRRTRYPFAVMIGTGKINAVSGTYWDGILNCQAQNYIVVPTQPWIDGYRVGDGIVRQFVSTPLGGGVTVEEQLTGCDVNGGIQIQVIPMNLCYFEERYPVVSEEEFYSLKYSLRKGSSGIGAGGIIKQKIYPDPFEVGCWNHNICSRVFVHLLNADIWEDVTGETPPPKPAGAWLMNENGVPWFELDDNNAEELGDAGEPFSKISSIGTFISNNSKWLLENIGLKPSKTIHLKDKTKVKDNVPW